MGVAVLYSSFVFNPQSKYGVALISLFFLGTGIDLSRTKHRHFLFWMGLRGCLQFGSAYVGESMPPCKDSNNNSWATRARSISWAGAFASFPTN